MNAITDQTPLTPDVIQRLHDSAGSMEIAQHIEAARVTTPQDPAVADRMADYFEDLAIPGGQGALLWIVIAAACGWLMLLLGALYLIGWLA